MSYTHGIRNLRISGILISSPYNGGNRLHLLLYNFRQLLKGEFHNFLPLLLSNQQFSVLRSECTIPYHCIFTAPSRARYQATPYPVTQVSITNYFCDFNCFLKNLQKLYKFSRKKFHVLFYVIKFLPVYPMYKPYNHLLQLRWHDGLFQIVYTHIQFKNFLSSFLILLSIAKLIHTCIK